MSRDCEETLQKGPTKTAQHFERFYVPASACQKIPMAAGVGSRSHRADSVMRDSMSVEDRLNIFASY